MPVFPFFSFTKKQYVRSLKEREREREKERVKDREQIISLFMYLVNEFNSVDQEDLYAFLLLVSLLILIAKDMRFNRL